MKRGLIIHISGSSGSGKSTLGRKLANKYRDKVVVLELDRLFMANPMEEKELISCKSMIESRKTWKRLVPQLLNKVIKYYKNKIIIFVGILQLSGFDPKIKIIRHEIKNVDYKFFINIPHGELLYRYYSRFCDFEKKMSSKENNAYWNGIASREKIPILGSFDIMKRNFDNSTYYRKNNYIFMKNNEIEKKIISVIKVHLAMQSKSKSKS